MALTTAEQESLRFHLGYGNIGAAGAPYTPDGYLEIIDQVVSANLSTGTETSATTSVSANSTTTVTPAAMTGIAANVSLVVDVGDEAEVVVVKAVSGSTFTAKFEKAHTTAGYPISTMCGVARCRMMLWDADKAWGKLQELGIVSRAGIKRADEVEFFGKGSYLDERKSHYIGIVSSLASLVQVAPKWADTRGGGSSRLEAY